MKKFHANNLQLSPSAESRYRTLLNYGYTQKMLIIALLEGFLLSPKYDEAVKLAAEVEKNGKSCYI